jgi:hypothetical protein
MRLSGISVIVSTLLLATPLWAADPHFHMSISNNSDTPVTVSFSNDTGQTSLDPELANDTPLAPGATLDNQGNNYGVIIEPLLKSTFFSVHFKGIEECVFSIGFFAPGAPWVHLDGAGCQGGGYSIKGDVLNLYVSKIK